MNSSTQ